MRVNINHLRKRRKNYHLYSGGRAGIYRRNCSNIQRQVFFRACNRSFERKICSEKGRLSLWKLE